MSIGFEGFVPLVKLAMKDVTPGKGIYVALRPSADAPYVPLDHSPLAHYTLMELEERWLPGSSVVYIGKVGTPTSKGGLKSRLSPYSKKAPGHSGGRSIWQLEDADELIVCWIETPGLDPEQVEKDYLDEFASVHQGQPFANLRRKKS